MSKTFAAIIGGAAGAAALVGIIVILIWFCKFRGRSVSRTSETESSDPSFRAEKSSDLELSVREVKRFSWEELYSATRSFSDQSLIGEGKFGSVYKGLLKDGMLVAIKRRAALPSQEFVQEVRYLSSIEHRNIVALVGYCQENIHQILVFEYISRGSVSIHLYGPSSSSGEKLEFRHRLAIALGAAKGLAYLHTISPRLLHKDFKTSNVLVDENFIAKVADAGIRNFLGKIDVAGASSQVEADAIFLAPEVKEFQQFSAKSDVYSFGVFLLELVCGREATESQSPGSDQNLVDWVQNYNELSSISTMVDQRLGNRFTLQYMEEFVQLIVRCIDASSELRPSMSYVVSEVDRIFETEMKLTTGMEEGTPTVTLGSQLFKALN